MTRRGKRVILICILITVASAVIIGYGVGKLLQTKDEKIDFLYDLRVFDVEHFDCFIKIIIIMPIFCA